MNNQLFDINKLPTDGYLVFPLSMSRLAGGQTPDDCFNALSFFETKVTKSGIDIVFLYTNGLYFNSTDTALDVRIRTNNQMLQHKNRLEALILKEKKIVPQAIHYLPLDYVLLQYNGFANCVATLQKLKETDSVFKHLLEQGLGGREPNDANISFLIEEIVENHLMREELVGFPKTLVREDTFRLMVYPGSYFAADLYQYKKKILPINKQKKNFYGNAQYDLEKKILYNFDKMDLPTIE